MKKVEIGTMLKDLNGALLKCVNIDGVLYECKYVNDNGELSEGSCLLVPSHFKIYEILG